MMRIGFEGNSCEAAGNVTNIAAIAYTAPHFLSTFNATPSAMLYEPTGSW
jgi:hypothetical protein